MPAKYVRGWPPRYDGAMLQEIVMATLAGSPTPLPVPAWPGVSTPSSTSPPPAYRATRVVTSEHCGTWKPEKCVVQAREHLEASVLRLATVISPDPVRNSHMMLAQCVSPYEPSNARRQKRVGGLGRGPVGIGWSSFRLLWTMVSYGSTRRRASGR